MARFDRPVAPELAWVGVDETPLASGLVELTLALRRLGEHAPGVLRVGPHEVPLPAAWSTGEVQLVHARVNPRTDADATGSQVAIGSSSASVAASLAQDFETGTLDGWSRRGKAFSAAPATIIGSDRRVFGARGDHLIDSAAAGDRALGDARAELADDVDEVCFAAGGGAMTSVSLAFGDQVVQTVNGHNDDRLRDVCWPAPPGKKSLQLRDASPTQHLLFDDLECSRLGRLVPCGRAR